MTVKVAANYDGTALSDHGWMISMNIEPDALYDSLRLKTCKVQFI